MDLLTIKILGTILVTIFGAYHICDIWKDGTWLAKITCGFISIVIIGGCILVWLFK